MYTKNKILVMGGLFVFVAIFFLPGCTKNATPMVRPSETLFIGMVPISSKVPDPTYTLQTEKTQSAPRVSPYVKVMVASVEIRYLETNPVQVELVIRGTLPDQCKYNFYSVENRANHNIIVGLDGIHPSNFNCLQTDQSVEYILRLGRDMTESERGLPPGDYSLTVNSYQTSFSIK